MWDSLYFLNLDPYELVLLSKVNFLDFLINLIILLAIPYDVDHRFCFRTLIVNASLHIGCNSHWGVANAVWPGIQQKRGLALPC